MTMNTVLRNGEWKGIYDCTWGTKDYHSPATVVMEWGHYSKTRESINIIQLIWRSLFDTWLRHVETSARKDGAIFAPGKIEWRQGCHGHKISRWKAEQSTPKGRYCNSHFIITCWTCMLKAFEANVLWLTPFCSRLEVQQECGYSV